jgi:hypothetical protein
VKTQQDTTVYQNFIIRYFKWRSTCFGRHIAHHQEPKTAQRTSGFVYVEGCRTCRCLMLSGNLHTSWQHPTTAGPTNFHDIMQNQRLLVQF